MTLTLERREQADTTAFFGGQTGPVAMVTPAIDEDYWEYRVRLTDTQAIVGFPKFGTIGIGFAVEEWSWNTNLPHSLPTDRIFEHIRRNKGDESIADKDVRAAIRLVQDAVRKDREKGGA